MRKEYNKIIERRPNKVVEEVIVRSIVEKEIDQELPSISLIEEQPDEKLNKELICVVSNCNKLNIREEPSTTAKILCVVDKGTEVIVDQTPSDPSFDDDIHDVWVHVRTKDVVGYVMGEFLKEV